MTRKEVEKKLEELATTAGSQRAAAQQLGISQQYFWDILHGHRAPGQKLLEALGLTLVESYEEKLVDEKVVG